MADPWLTYPLQSMPIMLRIQSQSCKQHTLRDITLGNTSAITVAFKVLRIFKHPGFVVSSGTIWKNQILQNLKMVPPITFENWFH
jgi:hypothetical protein